MPRVCRHPSGLLRSPDGTVSWLRVALSPPLCSLALLSSPSKASEGEGEDVDWLVGPSAFRHSVTASQGPQGPQGTTTRVLPARRDCGVARLSEVRGNLREPGWDWGMFPLFPLGAPCARHPLLSDVGCSSPGWCANHRPLPRGFAEIAHAEAASVVHREGPTQGNFFCSTDRGKPGRWASMRKGERVAGGGGYGPHLLRGGPSHSVVLCINWR